MDIHQVSITQHDVEHVLTQAKAMHERTAPMAAGAVTGDACTIYKQVKPVVQGVIAILGWVFPPGATALATLVAIMD